MRSLLILCLFAPLATIGACGASVETSNGSASTDSGGHQASSGHGGSGGAGGQTSMAASGLADATGTSVGGGSSSSVGAGGSMSTTGVGGSKACEGVVHLVADNGAPVSLTSSCNGTWGQHHGSTANGWAFAGGPVGAPHGIVVAGCADGQPNSEGVELTILDAEDPGMYMQGSTLYTDSSGQQWGQDGDPFEVTITELQNDGGVIKGTFDVTASGGGNVEHLVTGSFEVCHVKDELAP